jgi:peroxiredoxin
LVGKPAIDSGLPTADGEGKIKLLNLKGKIVLLNFFAYWCSPCNEEVPRLERIWREYKDKGVTVVGVAIWSSGDAFEKVRKFTQNMD